MHALDSEYPAATPPIQTLNMPGQLGSSSGALASFATRVMPQSL